MSQLPIRPRERDSFELGRSSTSSSPNPPVPNSEQNEPENSLPVQTAPTSLTATHPGPNLWVDALQKLPDEDQQRLTKIQPMPGLVSNGIDELIANTKIKQTECEKKAYKFSFQGREIILRDVAEKIVIWLNKFKEVGDAAVNFDPVHAALPWAAFRFCLQAAVAGHEQMGALLVSMEKATYLTRRCKIYETLYKPETVSEEVLQILHDGLIELYAAILRVLALCHRLFNKNAVKRAGHAIFNPNKLLDLFTKVQDLEDRVEKEAQNCQRERSQTADKKTLGLLEELHGRALRTDERVLSLLEKMDENKCLEILDWMSRVLYGKHHLTVKDQRTKDTCDWLLQHNHYREWHNESSSTILWLHGTPGTGKTYLTSRVIDEIRGAFHRNSSHEGLAFFYCNRNESERQKPLSVLRSFVRQLSTVAENEGSIQKGLKDFYFQSRLNSCEPTLGDCRKLLLEYVDLYPRTTLVLDALDECDKNERVQLIEVFDVLIANASRPVKIFISSRPDGDIKDRFEDRANIEIRAADNDHDISKFVQTEITKHPRWNKMPVELRKEIVETLQTRSQGMFQWAYLQIKQLLELKLAKKIRDRLGKLPKDLKDAYDEIYNSMTEEEKQIANRAFRWVMCAREPLPTKVLLPAVCQDEEDDTPKQVEDLDADLLLEYCHHLLVIDPTRAVWVPSHLSVIEYFETHLWSQTEADCLVSSVCLLMLNNIALYVPQSGEEKADSRTFTKEYIEGDTSDMSDDQGLWSLVVYAAHFWMIHARSSQGEDNNVRLSTLLKRFLGSPTNSSPAYQIWHETILKTDAHTFPKFAIFRGYFSLRPKDLEPASITTFPICFFGFDTILSDWWESAGSELTQQTQNGRSLLELAIYGQSIPVCQRLLDWGVDVNEHLKGDYGSALAVASRFGYKEIVVMLIEAGAEVNMQLQYGEYGSVLAIAIYWGEKETIELLLKMGAEVNMQLQYGEYGSALATAAAYGEREVIELLLEVGAEVNMQLQTGGYGSALVIAVRNGEREVVEFLLKMGAEVNMQLQYGKFGSALAAAAQYGKREVVELLLKAGAEVNMQLQAGYYGSALAVAAWWGREEVVELLLKAGAEVNMQLQYGDYGSALATAAANGEREVIELLLEVGAEVNIQLQAGYFGSALAAAASTSSYDEHKKLGFLLEAGADVNMQLHAGKYGNALIAAIVGDIDSEDDSEAYSYDSESEAEGSEDESGAGDSEGDQEAEDSENESKAEGSEDESEAEDSEGDYESWHRYKKVEFLLMAGADVNMQVEVGKYKTALAAAKAKGRDGITKLLLEYGAHEEAEPELMEEVDVN